jgi:hypothetical protein
MTTHWKTTVTNPGITVYAVTADRTVDGNTAQESTPVVQLSIHKAHAHLALEAIGNYARARGLALAGPAQQIDRIPSGLREVGWLCDFATPQNPVQISATVYERCAEATNRATPHINET